MSFLLDTCIISKLRTLEEHPNKSLESWISSHPELSYYLSAITLGEIQYGISKIEHTAPGKKMRLEEWFLGNLIPRFKGRILPVDAHTASISGVLRAKTRKAGATLPVVDSLIAATAIQHNLVLVTDNVEDFRRAGVHLFNPCQLE